MSQNKTKSALSSQKVQGTVVTDANYAIGQIMSESIFNGHQTPQKGPNRGRREGGGLQRTKVLCYRSTLSQQQTLKQMSVLLQSRST